MDLPLLTDAQLIIWAYDQTPTVDCERCEAALIEDANGNAPLCFTLGELIAAVNTHNCKKQ